MTNSPTEYKYERPKVVWKSFAQILKDRGTGIEDLLVRRDMGEELDLFVPTGLKRWDGNGGLTRGVLTVLAGVDGQGKGILRQHLATSAAKTGHRVAEVVFEDPVEKVADRWLSTATRIDSRSLSLLRITSDDLGPVYAAIKDAESWSKNIQFHGGLVGADEVMSALWAMEPKPDLVLLDYAQAFPEGENLTLERTIAKLAWDANIFAQKFNCAFVVFSQVKPEIAGRGQAAFWAAKRRDPESFDVSGFCPGPGTQDLAWSSAFGQRGRAVGYIFRPGYYEKALGKLDAKDDRLIIRWAKVNFGNSGALELGWDGPTARIYDVT